MDREAWQAKVHGVTKGWMRLRTHACLLLYIIKIYFTCIYRINMYYVKHILKLCSFMHICIYIETFS